MAQWCVSRRTDETHVVLFRSELCHLKVLISPTNYCSGAFWTSIKLLENFGPKLLSTPRHLTKFYVLEMRKLPQIYTAFPMI